MKAILMSDRPKWCAIHISDLEIFDKPKELSDFSTIVRPYKPTYRLTKAPQSFAYIEVGE